MKPGQFNRESIWQHIVIEGDREYSTLAMPPRGVQAWNASRSVGCGAAYQMCRCYQGMEQVVVQAGTAAAGSPAAEGQAVDSSAGDSHSPADLDRGTEGICAMMRIVAASKGTRTDIGGKADPQKPPKLA